MIKMFKQTKRKKLTKEKKKEKKLKPLKFCFVLKIEAKIAHKHIIIIIIG